MTMRKFLRKQKFLIFLLIAFIVGFSSCRTSRKLTSSRLKPMSAEKLLDKARQNAFEFDDLTIGRINVQFSDEDTKTSFRASLKATRNEKILASISKLSIPVGRVLLTPDSVIYVNYIDKNFFEGDYTFLSNLLNFRLNFNAVQAVISNPVKTGIIESGSGYSLFDTSVEDGRYVLQPVNRSNRPNSERRKIFIRNNNNPNAINDEELIFRKLFFNAHNFVLERLVMEDPTDDRKLEVSFKDFVKIDDYDYPTAIDVKMFSGNELTELNIKLRGFSTDNIDSLELKIPGRYQRVRTR